MNRDQINKIDEQVSRLLNERGLEYDDLIEAMIDYDGLIDDDGVIADDEIVNRFLDDLYRRCEYDGEIAADMITICGTLLLEGYFDDPDLEDEIIGYEIYNGKLWIYVCRSDGSGVLLHRIEQILEQYRIEEPRII